MKISIKESWSRTNVLNERFQLRDMIKPVFTSKSSNCAIHNQKNLIIARVLWAAILARKPTVNTSENIATLAKKKPKGNICIRNSFLNNKKRHTAYGRCRDRADAQFCPRRTYLRGKLNILLYFQSVHPLQRNISRINHEVYGKKPGAEMLVFLYCRHH